jgi:hypothetical protein
MVRALSFLFLTFQEFIMNTNSSPVTSLPSAGSAAHNPFHRLMSIDVSRHIERKGQFDYLSWPFAVAQLRQADPTAQWEIRRFDGLPYLATELGYFVEVAVTVQGVTLSQIHPVLDARNKPISSPTSFDINTSIQRCLVKAIALHGLGLSIYAGEDLSLLPDAEEPPTEPPKLPRHVPAQPQPQPQPTGVETLTEPQIRYIERLVDETDTDLFELLDYFGYNAIPGIPRSEANRVIRALQSKRRAA